METDNLRLDANLRTRPQTIICIQGLVIDQGVNILLLCALVHERLLSLHLRINN